MTGVLFFDGACGMCTRARDFLVRHDRTGDVETEPLQGVGVAERLGVPMIGCWKPCGGWTRPVPSTAVPRRGNAAWSVALGTRLPLLIYRIPGIRFVQNVIYRWSPTIVTASPAQRPYCESHPVAC